MKKHRPLSFSLALKQYFRYKRKYKRLFQSETKSNVKLEFLKKRILRLKEFLMNIKQKAKLAGALGALTLVMGVNSANAQSFNSTPNMNPFSLVNLSGGYSEPTFVDLDNDGDLDMMSGDESGDFNYFENTGSVSAPVYAAPSVNPFSLTNQTRRLAVDFGDLDNDGDLDIIGGYYGSNSLFYIENTGSVSAPDFATEIFAPFNMAYDNLYSFHPVLVDLDGDLDLDILAGEYYGNFLYYENTGTVSLPDFSTSFLSNPFGLGNNGYASTPSLSDLDNDGDLDLFTGSINGDIFYYENTGSSANPQFDNPLTNPFGLNNQDNYSTPVIVDLNDDGDLEMMVGGAGGNFYHFGPCSSPAAAVNTTTSANLGICDGGTTTLTGTGNANVSWYDDGGNYLASGNNFTTPVLNTNTTFYLQDSTSCSFNQMAINVIVTVPTDPTVVVMKAPIIMNGNANASSIYGSNMPNDAFNLDSITTGWGSQSGGLPAFLEYDFGTGNGYSVSKYSLYCSSQMVGGWGSTSYLPSYWNFLGYNGTDWDTLDTQQNPPINLDGWYSFSFVNTQSYEKYRIAIDSSQGMTYVFITEMKMYEAETGCLDNLSFIAESNTDPLLLSYQWKLNGNNVGTNSQYLMLSSFSTGDAVTCDVVAECFATTANASSNSYTVLGDGAPDVSVSLAGSTLTANMANATSYQWINCTTGANAIGTSTSQNYTVTATGSYAVIIYNGSCFDTSACTQVNLLGTDELTNENMISVYPNPNNGDFSIQTTLVGNFIIQNELGQVVFTFQSNSENNKTVSIQGLSNGMYFISGENTLTPQKIIVAK